ncbi:MAG: hypothetical protein GF320_02465 [Armatimonadia bacterium]|nr:hypothetical protein [Armatimonadia bacterium]
MSAKQKKIAPIEVSKFYAGRACGEVELDRPIEFPVRLTERGFLCAQREDLGISASARTRDGLREMLERSVAFVWMEAHEAEEPGKELAAQRKILDGHLATPAD